MNCKRHKDLGYKPKRCDDCNEIKRPSNSPSVTGYTKPKEVNMKIVPIKVQPNADAIEMLETALKKVKSGEITTIGLAWTTQDGGISGDVSEGKDNLLMWAALEHAARSFYADIILA